MSKIDFSKPVQTRDGRPVTILTAGGQGRYAVFGYIGESDAVSGWALDGTSYSNPLRDLVNAPEKRVLYVNVYNDYTSFSYPSREVADRAAGRSPRLACIRVEYTEGQFDD